MNCPHCNETIKPGAKFCVHCGKKIDVTNCCPQCHAELKPGAKFCVKCGTRITNSEANEMRNNLEVGDEITTIGGICGRIVTVKEDRLIIETGSDKNKMTITRWAVQANNTANERLAAERAAAKEAAERAKAEKKKNKENKDVL